MKTTISGIRYDSDRCEDIASRDHYNNNNYSGTTYLLLAKNGVYLLMTKANGQDLYLSNHFCICDDPVEQLNTMEMTDDQEKRAIELGLITEV
jgi:hypothetical protein